MQYLIHSGIHDCKQMLNSLSEDRSTRPVQMVVRCVSGSARSFLTIVLHESAARNVVCWWQKNVKVDLTPVIIKLLFMRDTEDVWLQMTDTISWASCCQKLFLLFIYFYFAAVPVISPASASCHIGFNTDVSFISKKSDLLWFVWCDFTPLYELTTSRNSCFLGRCCCMNGLNFFSSQHKKPSLFLPEYVCDNGSWWRLWWRRVFVINTAPLSLLHTIAGHIT